MQVTFLLIVSIPQLHGNHHPTQLFTQTPQEHSQKNANDSTVDHAELWIQKLSFLHVFKDNSASCPILHPEVPTHILIAAESAPKVIELYTFLTPHLSILHIAILVICTLL